MAKLINILSENSDFETKELSMMTGLSEAEVENEIKKYENDGVIKGYHAVVDWEKVEDAYSFAFIELKVSPKRDKGFDEMAEILSSYKEVSSVYLMAGAYDILLAVKGKNIQEISNFVAKQVATMDGILSTSTHFMLKTYKQGGVMLCDNDSNSDGREKVL